MVTTEEGWHTVEDGTKLYTKTWKPDGDAKARMVLIHGFSDHCNTYNDLCNALASQSIEVRSFDQRGWGRSVQSLSQRGLTGPTSLVLSDISSFLSSLLPTPIPLFLYGHSMGGGEVLLYTSLGPSSIRRSIRGYILNAPFIGFHPSSKPSPITVTLGRLASKVLPKRQMVNKLNPEFLSRDQDVGRRFQDDELCHDTGTLEGLAGLLDRTRDLDSGRIRVPLDAGEGGKTRIWIAHGTGDRVCGFEAARGLYERLQKEGVEDGEFTGYEGWYHRLHEEEGECKEQYANDLVRWILKRSDTPVEVPAEESKSKL